MRGCWLIYRGSGDFRLWARKGAVPSRPRTGCACRRRAFPVPAPALPPSPAAVATTADRRPAAPAPKDRPARWRSRPMRRAGGTAERDPGDIRHHHARAGPRQLHGEPARARAHLQHPPSWLHESAQEPPVQFQRHPRPGRLHQAIPLRRSERIEEVPHRPDRLVSRLTVHPCIVSYHAGRGRRHRGLLSGPRPCRDTRAVAGSPAWRAARP